ncbi:MAG: serine protease [Comamonadaceae bacterium]|nr:serine protease [Comamonadaceae bacterium]
MKASKKTRNRRSDRSGANDPVHPDELISMEQHRPAVACPVPAEVEPASRPLLISALDKSAAAPVLRPLRAMKGAYLAHSGSRLVAGLLGRSSGRLAASEMPRRGASSTPPHRPQGLEYSYLPRLAPRRAPALLRSLRGGWIQPENVYGSDDRVVFWPSGYPWHCAGRLFVWTDPANPYSMSSGSAVLVGPRHVLTAGHLCPWASKVWQMVFVPGYFDGQPVPKVDSYVSDYRGLNTGNVSGRDMAILRLFDPLGDQLGWFGSKQYQSRWQDLSVWGLIGWPGAIGNAQRPTHSGPFAVLRSDADRNALELLHHGDTSDGNSGGPLYSFWPDGFPYVVGTHSGTDLTENKDFNAAAGGRRDGRPHPLGPGQLAVNRRRWA